MFAVTITGMSVVNGVSGLVFCDGCGVVAVKDARGWRSWSEPSWPEPVIKDGRFTARRHHCRDCAEQNELLAGGLVYGHKPAEAVVYDAIGA